MPNPVAGGCFETDSRRLAPVYAADDAHVPPGHCLELVPDLWRHRDVDAVDISLHQIR